MNNETKGTIAIIVLGLLWGTAAIAIRIIHNYGASIPSQLFISSVMGSVLLFILYRKKIELKPRKDHLKWFISLGVLSSITGLTFFYAAILTKIAYLEFLHYTMPVWVFLLSAFWLKEKITKWKLLALVLAIIGIFLIFNFGNLDNKFDFANLGNVLALISAFSYAGTTVIARKIKEVEQQSSTFWLLFVGIFVLFPFFIFDRNFTMLGLLLILGYTIFYSIGGLLLYFYVLRKIEASKASILLLFEAVVATILAWIIFGEMLTPLNMLGSVFILAGSAVIIKQIKWNI